MSHVTITCPCCEITGRVRRKYAGRNLRCRHCCHTFRMPHKNDCIAQLLRSTAKTLLVPAKTMTELKGGFKVAQLNALRKLVLLREQGVITPVEFEQLRRQLRP